MALRVVRLGSPRQAAEGLRIGTVRRPPRGVPKGDFAKLDYYDVWLPELSPSAGLVAEAKSHELSEKEWAAFATRFRKEMKEPAAERLLLLLAALSQRTELSVGCYCADEARCHRSVLRELLAGHGARFA